MKVLNLYAGIGGNRKLWQDVEVTAIEYDSGIADIYKSLFPQDTVVVGDAHEFLLKHFSEYDFIWASPPCPTHSTLVGLNYQVNNLLKYPDMTLYQEIIILKHFFKGKYVVENVQSYYDPLIKPQKSGRHYFWANFKIPYVKIEGGLPIKGETGINLKEREKYAGFENFDYKSFKGEKVKLFKNMVEPEIGLAILNCARNIFIKTNTSQMQLPLSA